MQKWKGDVFCFFLFRPLVRSGTSQDLVCIFKIDCVGNEKTFLRRSLLYIYGQTLLLKQVPQELFLKDDMVCDVILLNILKCWNFI